MNDNQLTPSPSGGAPLSPLAEMKNFDALFSSSRPKAVISLMKKLNATSKEIEEVERSFEMMGCNITEANMPLLQVLLAKVLVEEFRDALMTSAHQQNVSIIQTAEQHRGEILRQSRDAHSQAMVDINAEIKKLSDEVLTNANLIYTKTRNQAVEVSKLIADLDPKGDLVGQFAGSVLQGVSEGIQAQADHFNEGMNHAIAENIGMITLGNQELALKIALVANEVQKIKDLNVPNMVSPITQELQRQMKSATDQVDSLLQKNREGLDALAKDATGKLKDRTEETKRAYVDMTVAAKKKFGELLTTAEGEVDSVIVKMEKAIEGKFWLERLKILGGMAVIAVLASGLTNYLLFFRYFKY
jgi:hypothetical protein